ncbi:MAG TPA: hypothetical protein VKA34_16595 [Balneolales bacterium]|nr:hypothetical protein [Balneolales bacterium]
MSRITVYQWLLVLGTSAILYFISPISHSIEGFFKGKSENRTEPGFWMLTSSLVISWIFAKSVTNAANLGQAFGFIGGLAYAIYYGSFLVAGWIIYRMRMKGNFGSIHEFLYSRYGKAAVIIFSLVIGFRLFNEVWSNTAVIGAYFGPRGSIGNISAIVIFTGLTLAYSLKGGFRSSLVTDMIQMGAFAVLLFIVLKVLMPSTNDISNYVHTGKWTMATGLNLCFVAFIQIFSYPFHDPVLTDRGFISEEKKTLWSFAASALIGFVCILLFSFVGIYARLHNISGNNAAVDVSHSLGAGLMLIINVIMITSAASTLDSTFSSVAKLSVVDISPNKLPRLDKGRWAMIIIAVLGSLPLLLSPAILSATTISGTMVIGLAPIFLFWSLDAPKISFYLSMIIGFASGILLLTNSLPAELFVSTGKYAELLAVNIYGSILCFMGFLIPYFIKKQKSSERSEKELSYEMQQ